MISAESKAYCNYRSTEAGVTRVRTRAVALYRPADRFSRSNAKLFRPSSEKRRESFSLLTPGLLPPGPTTSSRELGKGAREETRRARVIVLCH